MARSTSYLKRVYDVVTQLSEEYDVTEEEVEIILDHFFRTQKELIADARMPKIQITNLGTFKPTIGILNWQLRKTLHLYREGTIERDVAVKRISHLWPIKQRLIKEKQGCETWREWRDKEIIPNAKAEDKEQ